MKKRTWFLLGGLGIGALIQLKLLYTGGELRSLTPRAYGECKRVEGVPGAEDITFHPSLGFAYVSSDDRRAVLAGKPGQSGIFRYDPASGAAPVKLTGSFKQPFHAHGISLFVDAQGEQTLFVVNHPALDQSRVEKFVVTADGLLQHRHTYADSALVSANDVAAIDSERFYVTNDHATPVGLGHLYEDTLATLFGPGVGKGNVLYFDGEAFRAVLHNKAYSNGITVSRDGKSIALAEILGQRVSLFARDARTGALTLQREISLDTGPDNLEWDEAGNLWMAAHPKSFHFLAHAFDRSGETRAPTQVLRIQLGGATPVVEEMYVSAGDPLSAAATAAVHGKHLLLGPVFDPAFLHCRLP